MFSKDDRGLKPWLPVSKMQPGLLVDCCKYALPTKTVPLIVAYDWKGVILMHAERTG